MARCRECTPAATTYFMARRKPRLPVTPVTLVAAQFASVTPPPNADSFDVMVSANNEAATVEMFSGTKSLGVGQFVNPTFVMVTIPVGRWNQYFHGASGWNGPFRMESYAGAPHVLNCLLNGSPAEHIGYRFTKVK